VPRTLLDLAAVVDRGVLKRAVEEADRCGLLRLGDLRRVLQRGRGRRGTSALGAIIADLGEPGATRSELERRFADLCEREGLPPPSLNVLAAGFEVDALWPRQRLVVELDGYAFHRSRAAFERDRARDAALALAGFRVVRITFRRIENEPKPVAETIRSLLGARREG
jgi:hypothetical protein